MQLAWAASIVAQGLLLACLLRVGPCGWWERYLMYDLCRTAVLWWFTNEAYWLAWIVSEPGSIFLQILAIETVTETRSRPLGILLGIGAFSWSVVLTQASWPTARRASLLLRQACVYGCAGALIGSAVDGARNIWFGLYYLLHVARVVAEQFAMERTAVEEVNTISLFAVSALFSAWGFYRLCHKKGIQ